MLKKSKRPLDESTSSCSSAWSGVIPASPRNSSKESRTPTVKSLPTRARTDSPISRTIWQRLRTEPP